MAEVVLEHVRKTFGSKVVAVEDFSLTIPDREFTCLLGPSGSGKTTVLRMIAGLEVPDSGRVWIGGRDVTHLEPRQRDISMVFQGYALYPHLSVRHNIAYPLKIRGVSRAERERRVEELARRLEIEDLLDRMPAQLSGGQQQRVALARAMVRQPQAALYDEPLSALDARIRADMRLELRRLQQQFGVTTIMVTHDQLEAMTMSDWIAVMHQGRLQQFGTPTEVFHDPANYFVAGFVGEPQMNFFQCEVALHPNGTSITSPDFTLQLPFEIPAPNRQVVMGIRPQHVLIHFNGDGPGRIPGTVWVSEPEGTEAVHGIQLKETRIKVKTTADTRLDTDQLVWIEFPDHRLYFFDRTSGQRLRPRRPPVPVGR